MVEPTRRSILALTKGLAVSKGLTVNKGLALSAGALLMAADKDHTAWTFGFPAIDGGTLNLGDFKGRVLLVTNTASFCGYTYQYEALEKLHKAKSAAGL